MPIEVKHLVHTYSEGSAFQSTAINDVSVTLNDGEFICVVGHTGSGKSTFVQHLNGLLKPSSGQILIDGEDLNGEKVNRRAVRQKVGLVFQYPEYQLFEETIAKDIAFGPKNMGLPAEEIESRVRRAMAHVGLNYERFKDHSPFELSGGQMRRVAIAGVLAMEPRVLILDEPCAGLDPKGRDEILKMLKALHAEGNVTIVMVSHSMDDVARLATRVLVMSRGMLVKDGTPEIIFSDSESLRAIGLDIPEAVKLAERLREKGIDIPKNVYTEEAMKDAILAIWKERGRK